MSQDNATVAWRASHAWGEGGVAGLLPFLDSEVEWHPPQGLKELGAYRGHAGVSEYLGRFDKAVLGAVVQPVRIIDVDEDRVIALIRVTGRDEGFGGEMAGGWAWLIEMRRGKYVKVRTFPKSGDAIEAAGPAK
jgi:ketosteroid isomerase-like protein